MIFSTAYTVSIPIASYTYMYNIRNVSLCAYGVRNDIIFILTHLCTRWYHGRIDRATTDTILAGKKPGLFLLRDSATCPGDFVLSVR